MRWLAAAGLVACAAGCSDRVDPGRYYPPDDRARQAVEAGLTAWRQGRPAGEVPGTADPTVHLVDTHRTPGQRLKAFEVLGLVPGDGPRVFVVRLTLEEPAAEAKVKFVVVGIDPVWVFRQEDYDMVTHWDHPPKKDGAPR